MRIFCYISRRHKALNAHEFGTSEPTAKEQVMNYTSDILNMITVSRLEKTEVASFCLNLKTFCYIGSYCAGIEPNAIIIVSIRRFYILRRN